ncbi:MAG: monovalent cation/H(+) antiporter subunit G [Syntrophales bacterium]|nr:monovalent cation/H(+) antiporter subunit G [Syntrophales bacterium]
MVITVIAVIFMVAGLFFFTVATIGFLRFPDFYCRMHATGKGDTLGTALLLSGLALHNLYHDFYWLGFVQSAKLIFIAVFWFLANPTATHALLRAAFESDFTPWTKDERAIIEWPPKMEE